MGIILGIMFVLLGIAWALLMTFAYGMSDAPGLKPSFGDWIPTVVGFVVGGAFIYSHFHHVQF